jgi:hypothetical protein
MKLQRETEVLLYAKVEVLDFARPTGDLGVYHRIV